jgi:hypothetical protein
MAEKKQGILSRLFQSKGGCGCGVSIVAEEPKAIKKKNNNDKNKK